MNKKVVFVLAILFPFFPQASLAQCTSDDKPIPYPTDCTKFYLCPGNYILSCASGTHFSPLLLACDWPYLASCESGGQEEPPNPPEDPSGPPDTPPGSLQVRSRSDLGGQPEKPPGQPPGLSGELPGIPLGPPEKSPGPPSTLPGQPLSQANLQVL
uniref:Splicing factor 3B subunit 4-like n=1 Tax=Diabrotica virgifera virgifera TaxID=50390 RepID=A0A6P7GJI0_DIAVI